MKNRLSVNNLSSIYEFKTLVILFWLVLFICFVNNITAENDASYLGHITHALSPDSLYEDSTATAYESGDTVEIVFEGADTLVLLYEDSTLNDSLREIDITKDIIINLGGDIKDVQNGLFGVHIEGFFNQSHMNEFGFNYLEEWQALADLEPAVLRFPGGASSTFMHLLNYDKDGDGDIDKYVTGYGYDINELIRFYDITDGVLLTEQHYTLDGILYIPVTNENIIDDLEIDGICQNCQYWMSPDYATNFEKTALKYFEQNDIVGSRQKYIDQFIDLVDFIQDQKGYTIEVIVDLNIFTESAEQCKTIVEYLRDGEINGVTDVNVVGVEMGNECNLTWAKEIMGFQEFDDYWQFINGYQLADMYDLGGYAGEVTDGYATWINNFYEYVFDPSFKADHDFIGVFKGDAGFDCKVGITAANLPSTGAENYALRTGPQLTTYWNEDLYAHYTDKNHLNRYLFDAVILHPYYAPNGNFNETAWINYGPNYYPNSGFPDYTPYIECPESPTPSLWDYDSYDERLRDPFEKIIGIGSNAQGNFKQFIKSRYKQSYLEFSNQLGFGLTGPSKKELWTTEWNLKDVDFTLSADVPEEALKQKFLTSYCNSFGHGYLVQEWYLKDLKFNFEQPEFYQNFHTYSTIQNFGGGALSSLMIHADKSDRLNHRDEFGVLDPLASPPTKQNIWLKRTLYQNFALISEISKNNLKYLPSNFTSYLGNQNVQPTVFFDSEENIIYVYYSNIKGETQTYKVNYAAIGHLFPIGAAIAFDNATIYNVDAQYPYSNAGRNPLFTGDLSNSAINFCYNDPDNLHPFEIQYLTGPTINVPECTSPVGGICVTVPAYSFGYFTIPVYSSLKEAIYLDENDFNLYPNPSGSYFQVQCNAPETIIDEFSLKLLNINGDICRELTCMNNQRIDISNLPSGIYLVEISNKSCSFIVTKKLSKIE